MPAHMRHPLSFLLEKARLREGTAAASRQPARSPTQSAINKHIQLGSCRTASNYSDNSIPFHRSSLWGCVQWALCATGPYLCLGNGVAGQLEQHLPLGRCLG